METLGDEGVAKPVGSRGEYIQHCGVLAAVIGRVDFNRDGVCTEDGGEKLTEHNVLKLGHNYPPRLLVDFLIIPQWFEIMNLLSNSIIGRTELLKNTDALSCTCYAHEQRVCANSEGPGSH